MENIGVWVSGLLEDNEIQIFQAYTFSSCDDLFIFNEFVKECNTVPAFSNELEYDIIHSIIQK